MKDIKTQEEVSGLPLMEDFKEEARELKKNDKSIKNHTTSLNKLAEKYGYRNWATIRPHLVTKEV